MMKLSEAANRLSKVGVDAPDGVDWALAARASPGPTIAQAEADLRA